MPSLRLSRRSASGDVLATLVSALEVLQEASSAVATVPFLGSIVGAALGIARTVEKIRSDKERFIRLARRVSEFARHVEESLASDPQAVDDKLKVNLIEIQALLTRIRSDVEAELRRKPLSRFLLQSSISEMLDDRMDELDSAWRAFDTACLIALRVKLERQAMYDDHSQLRLFRWSDLRCLKVRGSYRVRGQVVGEEWEGRWEGRAVVIRTIRDRASPEAKIGPEAMVTYYPQIHHPYLAQVVGYSHPVLQDRFYFMDTGVIPLIHQFHGKDILSRLLQWLQLIVDYQSAFSYLHEVGIAFNECHSHDRCLPSAMLNEEGRLIVDAGDLEDANPGCFQSRLRRLYDEDAGATSPGKDYANDDVVMDCAIALQRLLKSHTGGRSADALDLKEFLGSDLAKIWASHPFQARVHHAQWGDYGYIKRDGSDESFVRLGNLYDLAKPTGKLTTFLLRRRREHDWEPAQDYPWAEDTVCHTFDLSDQSEDTVEDIAVVRTLPDDCEYHDFFWNHAEDVANEYGLNVHDIILFEEVFHYAGAVVCDTGINRATTAQSSISTGKVSGRPDRIYFHQLPLLASGEAPNPWGYWSIAADPTPGPWPPFEIPGVELTCRVQSNYARVSTFEAEVLVYLNQLRRNHILNSCSTSQDVSGRFEEIK